MSTFNWICLCVAAFIFGVDIGARIIIAIFQGPGKDEIYDRYG